MINVIMNKIINYIALIDKNSADMSGVFTYGDLAAITNTSDQTILPRRIKKIEELGTLVKFMRGFYITPKSFNPLVLSQRLCLESYISLETVLAKNLVIGSIPEYRITAVKLGRSRLYENKILSVEHLGIQKDLFFGFTEKDGIKIADPEKAFLDCLYFHLRGRKTIFNVYEDANMDRLDKKRVMEYLSKYKNPKFISFVTSILDKS
jgi:predicted transcriptional regulator of viral defense system